MSEHLPGEPACLPEHRVVPRLRERPGRRGDPAARAGDLVVGDTGDLLLVLLCSPAGEGQMRVAVDEAGDHCTAGGVDLEAGAAVALEPAHPPVLHHEGASLELHLAGAVVT